LAALYWVVAFTVLSESEPLTVKFPAIATLPPASVWTKRVESTSPGCAALSAVRLFIARGAARSWLTRIQIGERIARVDFDRDLQRPIRARKIRRAEIERRIKNAVRCGQSLRSKRRTIKK